MKKFNFSKIKQFFVEHGPQIKKYSKKTLKIVLEIIAYAGVVFYIVLKWLFIKSYVVAKWVGIRLGIALKWIAIKGYKFSRWLLINLAIVMKYIILSLGQVIYDVLFGAFSAIYDQFAKKQNSTQQNIGKMIASLLVLFSICFMGFNVSAKTVSQISGVFSNNPTLSAKEQKDTVTHVESLHRSKKQWGRNHQNVVLPNNDYMPTNVAYVDAKALPNSPLAQGKIQSNQYKNGNLRIVNKLFANPINFDEVFINKIVQGAQIAALSYGVNPSVLIAQAYVESGQGKSELAVKYNNYFGIKYNGIGDKVNMPTNEQTSDGKEYTINADFQVYKDLAEGMSANASLLRYGIAGQPDRYKGAWVENTQSYADATKALTRNYATAVDYNTILNKFIQTYGLYVLDSHPVHNPDLTQAK